MIRQLVLSALVIFAAADVSHPAPSHLGQEIQILRQEQDILPDGTYHWAYETENGISAEEQGEQVYIGPDSGNSAQGSYSWTSPEGQRIVVQYVADENGYQPRLNILSKTPPAQKQSVVSEPPIIPPSRPQPPPSPPPAPSFASQAQNNFIGNAAVAMRSGYGP